MQTPKQQHRLSYVAFAILAIILAGGIFFVTPRGRALAREILQFFTRASSDTLPVPTQVPLNWVDQTPGVPNPTYTPIPTVETETDCGTYQDPKCSVEQIRSRVDFTVKELNAIPEGMVFIGVSDGPQGVLVHYDTSDHSGGIALFEQPETDIEEQSIWQVGASAVVENVDINGSSGEYVKGSFCYKDGETETKWDPDADIQTLRWVDQGVSIIMQNYGTQLSKEEFITLARNLSAEPVSVAGSPAPQATESSDAFDFHSLYPLSVDEAQNLAGFTLPQPSQLPDILSLVGASFEPNFNNVKVFYQFNQEMGSTTDGLLLTVEPIDSTGTSAMCGFTIGTKEDYNAKPPSDTPHLCEAEIVGNLEPVKIGSISAQYAEGVWSGTDQGWEWNTDPYLKRLRWQKDGLAFELMYMGMEISREDMVAIAMNIK